MGYISVPVQVEMLDLLQAAYEYIQTYFPNWKPADGNLDTAMLQAWANDAAALAELASSVPDSIFRWYGATIVGIPPIDAVSAISITTWTAVDTAGYIVPAGTQVVVPVSGDTIAIFETVIDAIIPVGDTSISNVAIQAVDAGAAASGIGTPGDPLVVIDSLAFVAGVTLDATTSGGIDAEDDSTYLNRLTAELRLISPRLILPNDFATGAKTIDNVYRALAIDGYDPAAGGTYNNPREVSVACVDINGEDISAGTKTDVAAYFGANREVNFIANVIAPTYSTINVHADVHPVDGVDLTALIAAVQDTISAWLDPSSWGRDPSIQDSSRATSWTQSATVRYTDLVSIVRAVVGVAYINSVTLAINPAALGTANLTLPGAAPLTRPGTIVAVTS